MLRNYCYLGAVVAPRYLNLSKEAAEGYTVAKIGVLVLKDTKACQMCNALPSSNSELSWIFRNLLVSLFDCL